MQRAITYLIDSYGLSSVDDLYTCLKEEIRSGPEGGNCLYPNPLCAVDCVHISNSDHPNQPVHIDGSLELIADVELYSTCYPKKKYEGIERTSICGAEGLEDLPGRLAVVSITPLRTSEQQQQRQREPDRGRAGSDQLLERRRTRKRDYNLVRVLCRFNNCGPYRLTKQLQKRRIENLAYLSQLDIETAHLRKNIKIIPDALCPKGANQVFAYRGFLGITVQQHFYTRHRVVLKYPTLPCVVQFGGGHHRDLFPIELLRVVNTAD
ncbi:hypothetical protein niasHS_009569 [Heterodera schachtii]|uniref:Uncharacterized protein n=1 Tax=Heterodera schachtii TaxID=97005 RepID=A0ABD2JB38_HETSC